MKPREIELIRPRPVAAIMKLLGPLIGCIALVVSLSGAETHAWDLKPELSRVEFAVHATGASFIGHLNDWDAQFQAAEGPFPTAGTMTFPVAELKTGKVDRDQQMLAWLEAKRFPAATFVLRGLTAANGQFEASGDFTFHGVTRPISFPVRFGQAGAHRTVDGAATLDYREWNLKIFRKFGLLKVDPFVKVTFHFEAPAS
jgi:polyisoprenoid-binding protein YceI